MIKEIIKHVENTSSFYVDDSGDNFVDFNTRENGDGVEETPGFEDKLIALKLKKELEFKYENKLSILVETVDEWTILKVQIM